MGRHFATILLPLLCLVALAGQISLAQQPRSVPSRWDIPAIAKAANGAVVSIIMSDKDGNPEALGTGFLISKDGRILTNYHVIANGSSAIAKLPDGSVFPVDGVLAADKLRDVALIKAQGDNFHTLILGNSDHVEVGQEVVAIGNPLSLESTVSNGIVSGMRSVKEEGGDFLQITAPISPGSSGGPLFNMVGQVIGITTMHFKGGENLNFAIPINDAKRLLINQSVKLQGLPNEPEPAETSQEAHEEATPAEQNTCNEQAKKFVRYKVAAHDDVPSVQYTSHYDSSADKCYVESTLLFFPGTYPDGHMYVSYISIEDAYSEGEGGYVYGYLGLAENRGLDRTGYDQCEIAPPNHTQIDCRSEEEFDDLALKYFGVNRQQSIPANATIIPSATVISDNSSAPSTSVNPLPAPLPPNTKMAASPPIPLQATQEQLWLDVRYCFQNPSNNLRFSDGTEVTCGEINASLEAREKECKNKTGPRDEAKTCKGFLRAYKRLEAGFVSER